MKHMPQRTCVCCRKKDDKNHFVRIVKNNDKYVVDEQHKLDGRGAYFCKTEMCKSKVCEKKLLNRTFKTNVPNEVYEMIKNFEIEK